MFMTDCRFVTFLLCAQFILASVETESACENVDGTGGGLSASWAVLWEGAAAPHGQ